MRRYIFLFVGLTILLTCLKFADAKILFGDKINIEQPLYEEVIALGDEIFLTNSLQKEFVGVARKIFAETDIKKDFIGVGIKLNFTGKAEQDIVLIGNTIEANGISNKSMTVFGKNIQLNMLVANNLKASAENIEITGTVGAKTTLWGKNISVSGQYNDMQIYGNEIIFKPDTIIKGDLTYNSPEKQDLSHINIKGNVIWSEPFSERIKTKTPIEKLKKLYLFFSLLFPVLIMFFFFPNLFKQTTYTSGQKYIQSFISGLFLIIPTLIAIPIIFITIIGAPLGLIVTTSFLSAIYISRVFPSIFLGRIIFYKVQDSSWVWILAIFIGIFLFTTISLHPTAKILLNLLSIPAGFGALFWGRMGLVKRLKKEGIL
jgi:hypothetical protein